MNPHSPSSFGLCGDRFPGFLRKVSAFTLVELLVVMGVIFALMSFMVPAFNAMTRSKGVGASAYEVAGALETARSHAMANNTYAWVGFFEEDGSRPSTRPATAGIGRLVIAVVASKEGTLPYDPANPAAMDPAKLYQIGRLIKIEGVHLAEFPDGHGGGNDFANRPPVGPDAARISDAAPAVPSLTPFQDAAGAGGAQYAFAKAVQFNPRGEARINNSSHRMKQAVEIGLKPARGAAVDDGPNVAAIQFSGVAGNVKIYRP